MLTTRATGINNLFEIFLCFLLVKDRRIWFLFIVSYTAIISFYLIFDWFYIHVYFPGWWWNAVGKYKWWRNNSNSSCHLIATFNPWIYCLVDLILQSIWWNNVNLLQIVRWLKVIWCFGPFSNDDSFNESFFIIQWKY